MKTPTAKKFRCPKDWTAAQRLDHYTLVQADGCHLFTGTIGSHGYGVLTIKGETHTVQGMHVLHDCPAGDNRRCRNLEHLRLGTNDDNVADMMTKGRQSRGAARSAILPNGERHGMAKLTDAQALEIYRAPGKQTDIAKVYGVRNTTVSMIKAKQTWRHIHD